jgi:LuxR family maltose regulon positive regulatory protein
VIERVGLPDSILLAYLTLSRASLARGDERRALQVLEDLEDFALGRELPRLAACALAERVRIHAHHLRLETAEALLDRLDSLAAHFDEPGLAPFEPQFRLLLASARSAVSLAGEHEEAAAAQLAAAESLALQLGCVREQQSLKLMRVELARQRGDEGARALLREVMDLAALRGDRTLVAAAPPKVVRMAAEFGFPIAPAAPAIEPDFDGRSVVVGGLLTPKEAHVLGLLSQGLSNKLIARAMEISDETVKWHLKNLFAKLSAGNRKHAVGRARLLGLIPG